MCLHVWNAKDFVKRYSGTVECFIEDTEGVYRGYHLTPAYHESTALSLN